ncbi:unnamed protein product [Symbiodinium microadriaticum]|nr:unnamed protein product [Symbiodinium microadriaticum]
MRSYYESFGQAVLSDSNGESEQLEESGCDVERGENAGTGGISSDSRDRSEGPRWQRGSRGSTPVRQPVWDGWSEDGSYVGARDAWNATEEGDDWSWKGRGGREGLRDYENWSWDGNGGEKDWEARSQDHENWSWKTGCSRQGSLGEEALSHHWPKRQLKWEQQALYVEDEQAEELYHSIPDGSEVLRDSKGTVKVVGEDDVLKYGEKKQSGGRVSSTYPPVFRARPQESYSEWKRSVEFWIGGEGGQLPPELVGPRMMVQLRDRAAQLVKRLSNKDVNGPDGKDIIFQELERSPLIRQVDKHKIDEHRRRLMHLNRAPHESIESYITRAFYVGHLLDHAHLSRRDKAMIKTKAGTDVDEHLVTCAMVELATELEGEPGYPLGMSEPNMAKNGEELARHSFAAEGGEGYELFEDEPGEEDYEEADIPPELLMRENEAFGMHYKAKQKIAEVKKLRQYYRKPDNDTKRKALAEQMKVNPCHNCGELGHWSRECPHPKGGSTSKPQQVLVARTRQLPKVPEEEDDREWDLLVSLCRAEPTSSGGSQRGPSPQYKVRRAYPALGVIEVEGYDVLWSVQDLAFKIILDIGCMRSVAGVQWANLLVARWRREDRWFRVDPETETFKFGGGELLRSRFRLSFVGSFAGKPVVFAFSIVEGSCPPLFSRSGCTQLAAVIDCERHVVSSRKLGVKNYGVGQDSGHYTLNVDDCEPDCACLPEDFRVESGHDAVPIHASVLQERASSDSPPPRQPHGRDKPSKMQDLPELGSQDSRLPSDRGSVGRRLPAGAHEPGPLGGDAAEAHGATTSGQQVDISRTQGDEHHGDPGDEQYGTSCGIDREFGGRGRPHPGGHLLAKRRTRQATAKAKAIQRKALTGIQADYPSLSHAWSYEVAMNLVASTASRMRVYLWKKIVWQARVKAAVEAEGSRRWKRNPRWLAMLLGKEVASLFGHFGAMRQRMQAPDAWSLM